MVEALNEAQNLGEIPWELRASLQRAAEAAKRALKMARELQPAQYNRKQRPTKGFDIGDWGLMLRPPRIAKVIKLAHCWQGPGVVEQATGYDYYVK